MAFFSDLEDDAVARRLVFLAAVTLIVVPMLQATAQIWPLQLSNIQWRFGAANALSSVLLLPFLGLVLLTLAARGMESQSLARVTGAISGLFGLGLGASLVVFVLDALQLKTIVSTQMTAQFMSTSVRVGSVTVLFCLAFLVLTVSAFARIGETKRKPSSRASARSRADETGEGSESDVLIVGVRES